jgi:hypothetical protein
VSKIGGGRSEALRSIAQPAARGSKAMASGAGWPMFPHDVCHSTRYRIPGDLDADVDLFDYALFQQAFTDP